MSGFKPFNNMKSVFKLTAVCFAATLVACGGGGGGGSTGSVTPGPVVVVPPTPVADTAIVTSVPAATYAAGTGERAAFDVLNAERARCGFGLLSQNSFIDAAAAGHMKYLMTNRVLEHTEDPTKPDFYGQGLNDRFNKAGYVWSDYSEGLAPAQGLNVPNDQLTIAKAGEYAVRRLLSGPYHSVDILKGYRDIGISISQDYGVVEFGVAKGKELQGSFEVRTFPCQGTTSTHASSTREAPNPFPNETDAIWGQPIIVYGAANLSITSASVTGPTGPIAIKAIYGSGGTTDPAGIFKERRAVVIPSALKTNTTYSVNISGSNNGVPFTRNFSFTTGPYTANGYFATGAF